MTKEERLEVRRQEAFFELIIAIENFLQNIAIIMFFISIAILGIGEMKLKNLELEEMSRKYSSIPKEISFKDPFEEITVNAAELDDVEILQQENFSKGFTPMETAIGQEMPEIERTGKELNYQPSQEERLWAYRVAYAEARGESSLGQTLVINVAINNMKRQGYESLIKEFTAKNRYDSVIDKNVYIGYGKNKKLVETEDITEELKKAVDAAFVKDYSEELLKRDAESKGITDSKYYKGGACYFYNPSTISSKQSNLRADIKVKFECGNHTFYRYW